MATLLNQLRDAGVELSRLQMPLPEFDPQPPLGKETHISPDEELAPDEV